MSQIQIVGGGQPTPEQLAALIVTLQPSAAAPAPPDPRASWQRAALLEGVGFRAFSSHVELDRYHRSIA